MKFTLDWLKDFVDVKITAQALADKLTMAGLEVVSLEEKDGEHIFEIEITSNRPDWLSVIGIAREVAALTNLKLKSPGHQATRPPVKKKQPAFNIKIEDKKDCPLYTGKVIKNLKVKASPDWMKKRLELIGCRSVNNIVDITNYILFTYGHPLHAFDLDKISGAEIVIRRGRGEKIITISDKEITLGNDILVIADSKNPLAVAGVMGGKASEVTLNTKNILLESAVFDPVVIRSSRKKLGLDSESSYRFERGADAQAALIASRAAVRLILENAGGEYILDNSSGMKKQKTKQVCLTSAGIENTLGIRIDPKTTKSILSNLGFTLKQKSKGDFVVTVPDFRKDINLEVDLIEEVSRIYGFERIPATLPRISAGISINAPRETVSSIKNMLIGLGLNEAITYSLIDRDILNGYILPKGFSGLVEVLNPLSKEQEVLRPVIAPSLIKCIAHNLNQKQEPVNIFEVANVFQGGAQDAPREELSLAIALCGERPLLLEQGLIKDKAGFLHIKGIIEVLLGRLGIPDFRFIALDSGDIALVIKEENLGLIKKVDKNFLEKLEIKNKEVFIAELRLNKIIPLANKNKKFKSLPVFPGIQRDISIVLKEDILIEDIFSTIKENAKQLLAQANVADYYQGKQIPAGSRSLTISCVYRSDERTLTDNEVNPLHAQVLQALGLKFNLKIR